MEINGGLWEHMVMQRDARNFCHQAVAGFAAPRSKITGVDGKGREVFSARADGRGAFHGTLSCWRAGGPYALTLTDGVGELKFRDLWVGDVWMLAGQSNMQGYGNLYGAPEPVRQVRAFYMDDHWDVAREIMHDMRRAEAEVHWVINGGHHAFDNAPEPVKGVGPGIFFAREMWKRTRVPQGLIASAHGGTAMTQWDPALRDQGENSLYGAMYRRFLRNGGKLAGVLWYQGCNDACAERVDEYERRTIELFQAMRRDFRDRKLPIAAVQLGRTMVEYAPEQEAWWSRIREIQRRLPEHLPHLAVVPAIDLENDDHIHLSGEGQRQLGVRLAGAMAHLRGDREALPPIALGSIRFRWVKEYGEYRITVNFRNVAGKLHSGGALPLGFSLHHSGADSRPSVPPFRCQLHGKSAVLSVGGEIGEKIAYGFGCGPAVNIRDEAGRGLPAFGPRFFRPLFRSTPMLSRVEVSPPLMGRDDFASLCPDAEQLAKVEMTRCTSTNYYLSPERVVGQGPYVRFCRWHVSCRQAVRCVALIGSDTPFRLFCDGREAAGYPEVANPIVRDEFSIPLELAAGRHEFIIGLSGKAGNSWGFCLRFIDPADPLDEQSELLYSETLPRFV
ncbi:MAG: sialate O-acetylesterase [Lentisphaeria bacterium]|nr:sialate O-acetylesterase [Lentisphaeria bacterium]